MFKNSWIAFALNLVLPNFLLIGIILYVRFFGVVSLQTGYLIASISGVIGIILLLINTILMLISAFKKQPVKWLPFMGALSGAMVMMSIFSKMF